MTDLFEDKAAGWDERPVPAQISAGVLRALRARVPLSPDWTVLDFGAGRTGGLRVLGAEVVAWTAVEQVGWTYAVVADRSDVLTLGR